MNHNNVIAFPVPPSSPVPAFTDNELADLVKQFEREKPDSLRLNDEESFALFELFENTGYQLLLFGERFREIVDQFQRDQAILDSHYRSLLFA